MRIEIIWAMVWALLIEYGDDILAFCGMLIMVYSLCIVAYANM